MNAAIAAACVADQKAAAFWDFEREAFNRQEEFESLPANKVASRLRELAPRFGVELAAFDQCASGSAGAARVAASLRNAEELGVTTTPTLFIDGRMVPGFVDAESLQSLLNAVIKPGSRNAINGGEKSLDCSACGPRPAFKRR